MIKRILSYFPTKLPVGMKEFESYCDEIIALSGKYADKDSMYFAIASIMIHADSKHGSLPKNYFISRLRKSAANQVASQIFQDVKIRQAKAQEAELQQAEATAQKAVEDEQKT